MEDSHKLLEASRSEFSQLIEENGKDRDQHPLELCLVTMVNTFYDLRHEVISQARFLDSIKSGTTTKIEKYLSDLTVMHDTDVNKLGEQWE